jgi:hypothetical protein
MPAFLPGPVRAGKPGSRDIFTDVSQLPPFFHIHAASPGNLLCPPAGSPGPGSSVLGICSSFQFGKVLVFSGPVDLAFSNIKLFNSVLPHYIRLEYNLRFKI